MAVATVNIAARTNEPFHAEFLIREDGVAMDLDGLDLRMHVRPAAADGRKVLDLRTGNGMLVVLTGDPARNLALSIPLDVLRTVPAGTYVHDLKVWGGRVIWQGSFTFVAGVTR